MPHTPGLKHAAIGQRWTLNKNGVTPAWPHGNPQYKKAQENLNTFMDNIAYYGCPPAEAAAPFDADCKVLQGDLYQIRLTQSERATFRVNKAMRTVTMHQVGGHT
ncbi:MAG: hypothetical protein MUF21_11940 [Gemmatimonadaceae bacterium]|jgi:hypothetical protein|nr:hypothetical protein [Gemmatimonadaceae bacterium]